MKLYTIRMPETLWETVKKFADFYKMSRSDFVRYLIQTHDCREKIIVSKKDSGVFDTFAVVYDMCTAYDITKHYPDDEFRFHVTQGEGERVYFIRNGKNI